MAGPRSEIPTLIFCWIASGAAVFILACQIVRPMSGAVDWTIAAAAALIVMGLLLWAYRRFDAWTTRNAAVVLEQLAADRARILALSPEAAERRVDTLITQDVLGPADIPDRPPIPPGVVGHVRAALAKHPALSGQDGHMLFAGDAIEELPDRDLIVIAYDEDARLCVRRGVDRLFILDSDDTLADGPPTVWHWLLLAAPDIDEADEAT